MQFSLSKYPAMKPTNSSSVNQYLEITVESVSSEITVGSAVDMLTSHVTNPEAHPQYLTEAEGDVRYQPIGVGGEGGVTDHGALTGLTDDDHPQYLLADGSRNLNGNLVVTGALTVDSMLGIVAHQITLVQPGDEPSEVPTKDYVDSRIWKGTQAQYDALGTYDPDIIYVVTG